MRTLLHLPAFVRGLVVTIPQRPRHFSAATTIMSSSPTPLPGPPGSNPGKDAVRTNAEALHLLDALQSNRAVVSSISSSNVDMNASAIPEMLEWTRKAGYEVGDFAKGGLKCLHIAGTKGKGSVCVMLESILAQYRGNDSGLHRDTGKSLGKIGLYTSPHLITVRERIRIDGLPISEALFTKYFFELWDRFSFAASTSIPPHPDPTSPKTKPGYFRFLTILAFHVFLREGVETAIIECGIGGEYDSTNILPKEAVTASAITRLGIDHTGMLGESIEEIAWHKAGIMKTSVPAFTVAQVPEAQAVLAERATGKAVDLKVIERSSLLSKEKVEIGLEGDFQKDNASLAIAVAESHLQATGIIDVKIVNEKRLPEKFKIGLQAARWPGRCQVRKEGNIIWLLDGAHTRDSLKETAHWYRGKILEAARSPEHMNVLDNDLSTMLIFNQQDRDPIPLLKGLLTQIQLDSSTKLQVFDFAAFCTNEAFPRSLEQQNGQSKVDLSVQEKMGQAYTMINRNSKYLVYASVQEAVGLAQQISNASGKGHKFIVLVTGSLHLVGSVLQVLDQSAVQGEGLETKTALL